MKDTIVAKLLDINDRFYQSFGEAFAETRRRLQPGVSRCLDQFVQDGNWLDLGCGNGLLCGGMAAKGIRGSYLGVDFSPVLLDEARSGLAGAKTDDLQVRFLPANLMDENWVEAIANLQFDGVTTFAVLHHIPGARNRERLVRQVFELLVQGGLFLFSVWQFQNQPKLIARVQPWKLVDIDETEVETGDRLLDWRHFSNAEDNQPGLRYVHLFDAGEIDALRRVCGFEQVDVFACDGQTGNLGLYQIWRKP